MILGMHVLVVIVVKEHDTHIGLKFYNFELLGKMVV